jgi:hypothetical protein
MTDQVWQTLAVCGSSLVLLALTGVWVIDHFADHPKDEASDTAMGFGCAGMLFGVLLWTVAIIVWLAIHVRVA